jgi:hypothetical protein
LALRAPRGSPATSPTHPSAARAREALATIEDPEDRQLIEQDLESLPI